MEEKHYQIDMTEGPIFRKLLTFAIPLMCSGVLQLLFNAADIIVVGRFAGDDSMAAVGANAALINLLINIFVGLSVGVNVLAARYYGAKDDKNLSETVHTAMTLSLISGVVMTFVGVFGAAVILKWMETPVEIMDLSVKYIRIYFLGMTGTMIYNFGSAILRAVGDTKRPLFYLSFAGIINVILNLIFVVGFHMDVAGVAIATAVSQCISAALVMRCMIRETGAIRLVLKHLHIEKAKLIRILQIGLPAGIQGVLFSFSNVIIQSAVNSFGHIVVAGNTAAANIEGFIYVAMNAYYQGAVSFTSQNMGAGKYERINRILFTSQACVVVVGCVLCNLAILGGPGLLGIYSDSQAVIDAGMVRLVIVGRTFFLCGMMDVMVGSIRGMGYAILPMVVTLLGACGFRILWVMTVFQMEQFNTVSMLYTSYPISWSLTFLIHVCCYIWAKRKLTRQLKTEIKELV